MKTFNTTWNYSLNSVPSIGEKIILDFGNGMGSDRRFPYLVEEIREGKRGDFNIVYVEGRQLKKDGSFFNGSSYFITLGSNPFSICNCLMTSPEY